MPLLLSQTKPKKILIGGTNEKRKLIGELFKVGA